MTNEISTEFIAAHLDGPTGAEVQAQSLDRWNGQQRVTGLNGYSETAPKTGIAEIMAITALLAKDEAAPATPKAAPKPRFH